MSDLMGFLEGMGLRPVLMGRPAAVRTVTAGYRQAHVCACGYACDELEVMAIHQVNVHHFPAGVLEPKTSAASGLAHAIVQQMVPRTVMLEADSPEGPWTIAPGGLATKRYQKVVFKPKEG